MTRRLLTISLLFILARPAGASEITGRISTNPQALPLPNNPPPGEEIKLPSSQSSTPPAEEKKSAVKIPAKPNSVSKKIADSAGRQITGRVLGEKKYPDMTLVRSRDKKIYLIEGRTKKPVADLKNLEKYRGRKIYDLVDEQLAAYETRGHPNKELIREKETHRIYVIAGGVRRHIRSLEELRKNYFGLEIFNISQEEMALYEVH